MKRLLLVAGILLAVIAIPANAQLSSQQQKMKDCNTQASGMTGDARKQFMSSCLSGDSTSTKKPQCVKGKSCGNTCIANNKVCHQ